MVGVWKLEITESEEELKTLLREQKTASGKERIQLLYVLKSEQAESLTHGARLLGRGRITVQRWVGYRQGGLNQLLSASFGGGRKRHIPTQADLQLQERLRQPEGFDSYGEVVQWLQQHCGVNASYPVVHTHIRYRLKAKLKVPRPVSAEQEPGAIELFQKP